MVYTVKQFIIIALPSKTKKKPSLTYLFFKNFNSKHYHSVNNNKCLVYALDSIKNIICFMLNINPSFKNNFIEFRRICIGLQIYL